MKPYKFSTICKRFSCTKKSKYYSTSPSDIDNEGNRDGRNDYVFADDGRPLSGEAYTLYQFCEKIKISGKEGKFYDEKHILIFLGDVINGENGYFDSYNSYAFKLLYRTIEPYLSTGNILYIAGNHDKSAKFYNTVSKFPRNCVIETIEEGSRKNKLFIKNGIVFEHGHKFDCLCTGKNLLGLMGTFASDVVANLLNPDLEDILRNRPYYYDHGADNSIRTVPKETKINNMNNECRRVANGALKYLSGIKDSHIIVCGHTHQSPVKIVVNDGKRDLYYINTGKFSRSGYLNIVVEKEVVDGKEIWYLMA